MSTVDTYEAEQQVVEQLRASRDRIDTELSKIVIQLQMMSSIL